MRKRKAIALFVLCALIFTFFIPLRTDAYIKSGDVFYKHQNSSKKIALTFDDGPHPAQTDEILRLLSKHGIKATFFVVGQNVKNNPEVTARVISEGHEIGNHTYSHPNLKTLSEKDLRGEIKKTEQILFEICEYRPKLFRPPCGFCDENTVKAVSQMDYYIILWTVDTLDWNHTKAQDIVDGVTKNVKDGSIILCHDYIGRNGHTAEALDILIPKLKNEGYQFVTVSELLVSN